MTGLAPGAYHYLALEGKLERLGCRAQQADQLTYALAGQEFAGKAPACLVWTAVPYRSEWRYDSHGTQGHPPGRGTLLSERVPGLRGAGAGMLRPGGL